MIANLFVLGIIVVVILTGLVSIIIGYEYTGQDGAAWQGNGELTKA